MFPGLNSKRSVETVASSTVITVLKDIVILTGTTTIATINPPNNGGFACAIHAIPTGGNVSTTTSGNIAVNVTMPQNRITVLTYVPSLGKWYPGAIS